MNINGLIETVNAKVLLIALIFILFDLISGVLKAVKNKNLDSTKMREGLINKVIELFSIVFGFICEYSLPQIGINVDVKFGSAIATYIVIMELCSVIENLGEISPEIGKLLSKVFEKLKEKEAP